MTPIFIIYLRNWIKNGMKTDVTIVECIEINRDQKTVFSHLTDFETTYPLGFIKDIKTIDQPLHLGSKLSVQLSNAPSRIDVSVSDFDEERGLFGWKWNPGGPFPSFHQYFQCEPIDSKRCRLIHMESFNGIFVPLVMNILESWRPQYKQFNELFKIKVES